MADDVIIRARTGIVKKVIENVFWYVSKGTEGNTLTFNGTAIPIDLRAKNVIGINRENYELKPTSDQPTPKEYNWNAAFAQATFTNEFIEGEQIKITYS